MKRALGISALVFSLLLTMVMGVSAQPGGEIPERKIIVFKHGVDDSAKDREIQKAGAEKINHLELIGGSAVLVTASSRRLLESSQDVERIDDDVIVKAHGKISPLQPAESIPWGVDKIGADRVWGNGTASEVTKPIAGNRVRVAVLDTGIDVNHPDLKQNVAGGKNLAKPRRGFEDDNGHGTHVAGVIAGVDNKIGVIGVAPKVDLYAVKVLDENGDGYMSDIISGLEWCVKHDIQVVNMSFGSSTSIPSFGKAIEEASRAGIVIVASAGNLGAVANAVEYPARYPEVIAVGATDPNDAIASWSSNGPEISVVAPGANILSTYKNNGYQAMWGTSMAAPHVAGTAALVIQSGITDENGNGRTNDEVRARIQRTAVDLGAPGRDDSYGHGRVDAPAAVLH